MKSVEQYALVTPADAVGTYYFPFAQDAPSGLTLAVQSEASPTAVEGELRRVLAELDPRLPLFDVRVMRERVDHSLRARRATKSRLRSRRRPRRSACTGRSSDRRRLRCSGNIHSLPPRSLRNHSIAGESIATPSPLAP